MVIDDATIRVLDLRSREFRDHSTRGLRARVVTPLPDPASVLVLDFGGTAHRLDLEGEEPPRRVLEGVDSVTSIDLGVDGRYATAIINDPDNLRLSSVLVIDLRTLAVRTHLRGLSNVLTTSVGPGGALVAVGMEGKVQVLDGVTGRRRFEFRGPDEESPVLVSPDGSRLASAWLDGRIRLWSLETGQLERTYDPVPSRAASVAFGPDGRTLASGHEDGSIRVWDADSARCLRSSFGSRLHESVALPGIRCLRFAPGGRCIVGLAQDGVTYRTTPATLSSVLRHPRSSYAYAYDVSFHPSGREVATAGWDGTVRIWDVATRRLVTVLECGSAALWARYSLDGTKLLTCVNRGWERKKLVVWDTTAYRRGLEFVFPCNEFAGVEHPRRGVLLFGWYWALGALDMETLEPLEKREQGAAILSLAIDRDGTRVACGLFDGRFSILDGATLEPLHRLNTGESGVTALAFSPDGTELATGSKDGRIRLWNAKTGRERLVLGNPELNECFAIRWTADGRRILAGTRNPAIHIWEAESGRELLRLAGHENYVRALAFSPDERSLASASGDNTIRLWDARPLGERIAARDRQLAAEQAVRSRVESLYEALKDGDRVLEAIRDESSMSEDEKHAARVVVFRLRR
jgi:WD40 repeat protein